MIKKVCEYDLISSGVIGGPTSSSCRFPEAFIRMVAILSPSTVRVDCSASWSPASPSLSLSASSSEKHVCNSPISSCSIRISSIKAWTNIKNIQSVRGNIKSMGVKLLKKQQKRLQREVANREVCPSCPIESNCIGRPCEVGIATENSAMQSVQPLHRLVQY